MKPANQPDTRQLRAIGHKLKPVVSIASKGLSDTVLAELERALNDHELIKVKVAVGDRDAREAIVTELCATLKAQRVQRIGNTALILRRTAEPNPRLSNLLRPL